MTPPLMRLGSVTTPGTLAIGGLPPDCKSPIIAVRRAEAIEARHASPLGHRRRAECAMRPDRREILKISAAAVIGAAAAGRQRALAQQVKWSAGTETPKLKAPANACDCHH